MPFKQGARTSVLNSGIRTRYADLASASNMQSALRSPFVVHRRCARDVQERSTTVWPLADALCARALVTLLGRNRVANLALIVIDLVMPERGSLAQSWHILGTILARTNSTSCNQLILNMFTYGAGRGGRTPTTLRSADFESAASASSAIPACESARSSADRGSSGSAIAHASS